MYNVSMLPFASGGKWEPGQKGKNFQDIWCAGWGVSGCFAFRQSSTGLTGLHSYGNQWPPWLFIIIKKRHSNVASLQTQKKCFPQCAQCAQPAALSYCIGFIVSFKYLVKHCITSTISQLFIIVLHSIIVFVFDHLNIANHFFQSQCPILLSTALESQLGNFLFNWSFRPPFHAFPSVHLAPGMFHFILLSANRQGWSFRCEEGSFTNICKTADSLLSSVSFAALSKCYS